MKITFVLPGYPWKPAGGYRVVYEYANNLVERGHEIYVVHARMLQKRRNVQMPLDKRLRRIAGFVRNCFFTPSVNWQYINPKVKMLYVPEPISRYIPNADAVFATAWITAEYVLEYPPCKGKKFYLIQGYETWAGPEERVNATWHYPLKKVVIAKWLNEKGLELGVPENDMVHIPNGIDLTKYCLKNDIVKRSRRVAMLYSNIYWKGAVDGISALRKVKKNYPSLKAVLFGTVPRPNNLPEWCEYFYNPPQDILVNNIYNGSSVFLCPSLSEGWGLPLAEAMACGCAVVSTDNGGVRDYALEGDTALLSPPGDSDSLASNLNRLISDDSLRQQLALKGHKNIQKFTWKRATDSLEVMFNHVFNVWP